MEELYWGLWLTTIGGLIAILKDWKDKDEKRYVRDNGIAFISFMLVIFGGIKSCSYGKNAVRDKNISDSVAKAGNIENKILLGQIDSLQKIQLDSIKNSLSKSMEIIKMEEQGLSTQRRISSLQNELFKYTIGVDSYLFIEVGFYQTPNSSIPYRVDISAEKRGNDPLYGINISIEDRWKNIQHLKDFLSDNFHPFIKDYYMGDIFQKGSVHVCDYELEQNQNEIALSIFIDARKRHFYENFKCINVNQPSRKIAVEVTNEKGTILFRDTSPNFPKNKDGSIDWNLEKVD